MRAVWIVGVALLALTAAPVRAQDDSGRSWPSGPDMTPARRAQLQQLRERYRDASPDERQVFREQRIRRMQQFRQRIDRGGVAHPLRQLAPDQRAALREQVIDLPPAERRELRRKLRDIHALSDVEREELTQRFEMLRSLDLDERRQFEHNVRRWKQLAPEQRERLRDTWQQFKSLPPERQQELLDQALLDAAP